MAKLFVRERSFYKEILIIGLPVVLQQLITVGVNMTDNVMLGRLGEIEMSGVSLANQITNLHHICCMGIGMGASVLISRYWGMGEQGSMKKAVKIMLLFVMALSAAFCAAAAAFPAALLRLFTDDAAVIREGVWYFRLLFPTYFLSGVTLTTTLALRSVGKGNLPLLSAAIGFAVNVLLNWALIFGNLGMPQMGVAGAALATLIARFLEFAIVMGYFFHKENVIAFRLRDLLRLQCRDLLPDYMRICLPVLVSDTIMGLGNTAVSVIVGHIGTSFVSAVSITTVVQQLTTVVAQAIGQVSCIITGRTLGRGAIRQAKEQGTTFVALGFLVGVLACGLILLAAEPIVSIYRITDATKETAISLMYAVAITTVFLSANSILTKGVLRGGGDTRFLMAADVIFLWCTSISLGALSGLVWHWPAFWVFFMLKIDQILKTALCIGRMRSGKWIKKIAAAK